MRFPSCYLEKKYVFDSHPFHKLDNIYSVLDRIFFERDPEGAGQQKLISRNYYEWYYAYAQYYKPKSILEIGTRFGHTVCSMISGCQDTIEDVVCWDIEDYVPGKQNEMARNNIKKFFPKLNFEISKTNSQLVNSLDRRFDLIHIDADHSFEAKIKDLNLVKDKCNAVILDDYDYILSCKKGVDEFIKKNERIMKKLYYVPSTRGTVIMEF